MVVADSNTNELLPTVSEGCDLENEEDFTEPEFRAEACDDEELTDTELNTLRRELTAEVAELEWEFKQAKEALYNERMMQVEDKLTQARSASAPEFLQVRKMVEDSYHMRRQVAHCRQNFALDVVQKELDSELQVAECRVNERLTTMEDQLRLQLQESICRLQVERAIVLRTHRIHRRLTEKIRSRRTCRTPESAENGMSSDSLDFSEDSDDYVYLPNANLEPRKKPVTLSPTAPRLIYQLHENEILLDVETIMDAVKEHKIAQAMVQMKQSDQSPK